MSLSQTDALNCGVFCCSTFLSVAWVSLFFSLGHSRTIWVCLECKNSCVTDAWSEIGWTIFILFVMAADVFRKKAATVSVAPSALGWVLVPRGESLRKSDYPSFPASAKCSLSQKNTHRTVQNESSIATVLEMVHPCHCYKKRFNSSWNAGIYTFTHLCFS